MLIDIDIDKFLQDTFDTWCFLVKATTLSLPKNWDSYGALPVNENTVDNALKWICSVKTDTMPLPEVVPTVRGGVQFEWHFKGGDIEVSFVNKEIELFYEGEYFDSLYNKGTMEKWVYKIITSCI